MQFRGILPRFDKYVNPKKIHFFTLLCSIFAIFEWHDFKESDLYLRLIHLQQTFKKVNFIYKENDLNSGYSGGQPDFR